MKRRSEIAACGGSSPYLIDSGGCGDGGFGGVCVVEEWSCGGVGILVSVSVMVGAMVDGVGGYGGSTAVLFLKSHCLKSPLPRLGKKRKPIVLRRSLPPSLRVLSAIATAILRLTLGYVKAVTIDMGFLVKVQPEEEFPEKLFGAVRLCQMELNSATFVDNFPPSRKVLPCEDGDE
ncbi:unnamed protein product [Fraxinus pennsylvanica]|uniref:Protein ENHANCED DISEASE RESISTANCE 2 C-terminal domain-containing protein n=1 Tax=Fraxinus pennsylvanica TaxID=56036 RepID=A0AAD2ABQ6_9LAMI|nr:unnamed protein product [Fraxinus pennsylvanica]